MFVENRKKSLPCFFQPNTPSRKSPLNSEVFKKFRSFRLIILGQNKFFITVYIYYFFLFKDNRILDELDGRRAFEDPSYITSRPYSGNKTSLVKSDVTNRELVTKTVSKDPKEFHSSDNANKNVIPNVGAIADLSLTSSGVRMLAGSSFQTNNTLCQVSAT